MTICPFLSNPGTDVECFNECAFYEEDNVENCPFRQIKGSKRFDINSFFKFDDEEELEDFEETDELDEEFTDNEEDFF